MPSSGQKSFQTTPIKMVSHNHLRTEDEGGETAFIKAREMGISLIRYDFRYRQLATAEHGWQWDTSETNRWNDLLDPSLRWTKKYGMRTLVNLLAYSAPSHSMKAMNERWTEHWAALPGSKRKPRTLNGRECALFSAWAEGNGVDLDTPGPKAFTEALLDRLAEGQERNDYDIVGFCILNEPNTKWPGEPNWRSLEIPGNPDGWSTYSTASYCRDMCRWVKAHIEGHHRDTLGHTVNVVNLYSYRDHWRDANWRRVAADPALDVLGIDIYWDQLWGVFARGRPAAMRAISEEHGKDWWLVETAGADNPAWARKNPSCRRIKEVSDLCTSNGAKVLGYYRMWGDYGWPWNYGSAYNVYEEPGDDPTSRTDRRGNRYWENIRDI